MTPTTSMRVLVAALAVTASAAACGGADGSGDEVATLTGAGGGQATTTTGGATDPQDAFLEFAECMREHGVDLPDPEPGDGGLVRVGPGDGPDPSDPGFAAADEACRPILDAAMADVAPPDPEEQAAMRDRMLAFARCMREHGVDMPDPSFGDDGSARIELRPGGGGGAVAPAENPAFEAAHEACGDLLGPPAGAPAPGAEEGS